MSIPVDPEKTPEDEPTVEKAKKPRSSDYRSAATGQFVTEDEAETDPERTVKEERE